MIGSAMISKTLPIREDNHEMGTTKMIGLKYFNPKPILRVEGGVYIPAYGAILVLLSLIWINCFTYLSHWGSVE